MWTVSLSVVFVVRYAREQCPLPVATKALRQQELAVGREIAPPMEIAALKHAATLALTDSADSTVAGPSGGSLPIPKRRLFKKTSLA